MMGLRKGWERNRGGEPFTGRSPPSLKVRTQGLQAGKELPTQAGATLTPVPRQVFPPQHRDSGRNTGPASRGSLCLSHPTVASAEFTVDPQRSGGWCVLRGYGKVELKVRRLPVSPLLCLSWGAAW